MCFTLVVIKIKVLLLTLIFMMTFPLALILFSPIYIYRQCISWSCRILRRNPGKMLSTKSSVFAVDTMYNKPKCTLLVFFLLQGHLDLTSMKKGTIRRILNKKILNVKINQRQTTQEEELTYPELKQYLTKWMGYYFWENEKHFNVDDHIGMYEGSFKNIPVINEKNVPLIGNELINKPFERYKSPWEVLLLHNVSFNVPLIADPDRIKFNGNNSNFSENENQRQTLIMLRVHHSLADGISLYNILTDLAGFEGKFPVPEFPKLHREQTKFQKIMKVLFCPFKAPFEVIGALVESYDVNSWHLKEHQLSGNLMSATSTPIPVQYIKDIKNFNGTTFMSVLLAAMTGGIRNFMIANNIPVPQNIHCLTPLPMPGHSEKLRNHFTAAAVRLPLGKEIPRERLVEMGKIVKKLKTSTVPATNYLFYPVIGGLLPCMARRLFKHTFTTAILSSLPAPQQQMHFEGHPILDISYGAGLLPGNIGIGFSLLSYNGAFRIIAGGDQNIIHSLEKAQELVNIIVQELDIISHEDTV